MSTKTHMHSWMETEITGELNGWNDEDGGRRGVKYTRGYRVSIRTYLFLWIEKVNELLGEKRCKDVKIKEKNPLISARIFFGCCRIRIFFQVWCTYVRIYNAHENRWLVRFGEWNRLRFIGYTYRSLRRRT